MRKCIDCLPLSSSYKISPGSGVDHYYVRVFSNPRKICISQFLIAAAFGYQKQLSKSVKP